MEALTKDLRYADVLLLDRQGKPVLSVGHRFGNDEHLRRIAVEMIEAGDVVLRDFHRDTPSGAVHLGLNLALRLAPDAAVFGVLTLGIDPETYLYRSWRLGRWPVRAGKRCWFAGMAMRACS